MRFKHCQCKKGKWSYGATAPDKDGGRCKKCDGYREARSVFVMGPPFDFRCSPWSKNNQEKRP